MSDDFKRDLLATMPAVRGFARTFERNGPRADDLVQETMVKAWANREKFQPGSNMKAWLFTILRNAYISQIRKHKREVEDADGSMTANLSEGGRQEGHMAMLDLRAALALLPEDQREAVILVGAAGLSYDEAAEVVGVAAGTVKSRVSRARAKLSAMLGETAETLEGSAQREPVALRPAAF
ncbi:MAG: sigma-70 family RNA polymerase sigma factor [Paracoccaceae bacterium]